MINSEALMQVRTALTTTTNVTGGLGSSNWGGVEIQKKIDTMMTENINSATDFRQLVTRKPNDQFTYFWNIRTSLGSTNKSAFQATEGGTGIPYASEKIGMYAPSKSLRSDYEVTNIMLAGSASFYDALEDEAKCAIQQLGLSEEKAFLCGTDTNAYGLANAYLGLLQLMGSYVTLADTTSIFGTARASGKTYLDVALVNSGTAGTATGVLELKHLDDSITKSNKAGAKGRRRIFLVSEERGDEIDQLLQPAGRFVIGARLMELDGGMTVTSYKGIPIMRSRFMDKNGVTNTGSVNLSTDADNAMYLLDMDMIEFRVLSGVDSVHVPIIGSDSGIRYDVQGGFFKTYGVLTMRQFNTSVLIWNLTAP